eukprot:291915-Amphidinium_carterae.1
MESGHCLLSSFLLRMVDGRCFVHLRLQSSCAPKLELVLFFMLLYLSGPLPSSTDEPCTQVASGQSSSA